MTDAYSTLGVPKGASAADIKKAYRKLAAEHHPDRQGGNTAKFQEIQSAYETLSDPVKRQQHDNPHRPGPGGFEFNFSSAGHDDIFREFFNFNQTHTKQRPVQLSLWINLEDIVLGGQRTMSLQVNGKVEAVKIEIPVGIEDGASVKYPNLGPSGQDLIIMFRIHPHKMFKRGQGLDLICDLSANFWQLILGTELPLQHLNGKELSVVIPPKTKPDSILRLRGQGIQRERHVGDLYVKINALLPENISDNLLELLRDQINK